MSYRPIPTPAEYDARRPSWGQAGEWDRAVHLSRARARLGSPSRWNVERSTAGDSYYVIDQATGRKEQLP